MEFWCLVPCRGYLGAICWRPHPSSQNPTGTCTIGDISDFCVAVTKFLMAEQEAGNQTGMEARFKPHRHSPNSSRLALPPAISATTHMALPPGTKHSAQESPFHIQTIKLGVSFALTEWAVGSKSPKLCWFGWVEELWPTPLPMLAPHVLLTSIKNSLHSSFFLKISWEWIKHYPVPHWHFNQQ